MHTDKRGRAALLSAQSITKVYGRGENIFTALDSVSLDIEEGESLAIVGKSGSGKSTLMHLLALLDSPTSGSIELDGAPISRLKPRQIDQVRNRRFGFVFQQFFLNGNETVLDNVILPLKIAGLSKRDRTSRATRALEAVGLTDKIHSKAGNLSGGQKQRVAIARAITTEPQVIFADEPTGNLDSQTGAAVQDLLFSLNKEREITLVIVTHDMDLAQRCDRRVFIRDGKLVAEKRR